MFVRVHPWLSRRVVAAASLLAPAARRREFLAQWHAELAHYAQWLERQCEPRARLRLLARATGAVPHAAQLRLLHWSPRMLGQDLKFAWRMFVRRPAFTGVAVLILALGIGANTTIFSWMQSVLFSPLGGVERQDRIFVVLSATAEREAMSVSYPNFQDLRAAAPAGVADLMAFRLISMNLRADAEPMRVYGALVSGNFLEFLGVTPVLGRGFRQDEGSVPGRDAVLVISHEFWTRAFAASPDVIGRAVSLNGRPFTIVGVTPAGFHGPAASVRLDVYAPVTMQPTVQSGDRLGTRGGGWLDVYGRRAPGVSIDEAGASIGVIGARLAARYPEENGGRSLRVIPLWRSGAGGALLPILVTLMGMVLVVLLIACANIAGLILANAASRQREVAVRLAVGASRWRVVRQMLIETSLLSLAGCAAGLLLARWTAGLLDAFVPRTPFPLQFNAGLDAVSVGFAVAASAAAAILAGVAPALRTSSLDAGPVLKAGSPTRVGGRGRLRRSLVVAQVALSALLLVCASLFTRSLAHSGALDPGFALRQGVLASIDLQSGRYDADRGAAFVQRLLDRVSGLPGVTAATIARTMPLDLGGSSDMSVKVDGYVPREGEEITAYYNQVGPAYFETMGIPLVRGRGIGQRDVVGQPLVAVINETMAQRYWPDRDPIGAVVRLGAGPVTIVGVARDGKYSRLNEAPRNYMYVPALQMYRADLLLHVRTEADPAAVLPSLRAAVRDLDPNLALFDVRTIDQHLQLSLFLPRIAASMLGLFGGLGLLLAAVGLFGVVGFDAAQRTREIGLRVALGAERRQVIALILRGAAAVVASGLVVGLALSAVVGRLIASQLMGVSGADPVSFAGTAALLAIVAATACLVPAWRASGASPLSALRAD